MFKFLKTQQNLKENYAAPSKRFLAFTIDNFILTIIRYIVGIILVLSWYGKSFMLFANGYADLVNKGHYDGRSSLDLLKYFLTQGILYETIFFAALILALGTIYWVIMPTTKYGGTIGKIIFGIKIVNKNNEHLSLKEAFYRYITGLIPWGFHIIVLISIFSKNVVSLGLAVLLVTFWYEPKILKRSYLAVHDLICNTKVINAEAKKKTKKKK